MPPSEREQGGGMQSHAPVNVTPPQQGPMRKATANPNLYLERDLTVNKKVVDELLLVCGVIGSTVDPATQKVVPVEDCLNWLQDLQRALRRDNDIYRPISLLLGKWNVVQQKLLPLVLSCRYDTDLVITIVKILVILTKPISENAKKAGRFVIDTKKTPDNVIRHQNKLRENAIAQANLLKDYKRLFAHHPSHRKKSKDSSSFSKMQKQKGGTNGRSEEAKGLLSVFVSLLAEPLSRTGSARTDNDHLTIELILHLFRNILSAGDPLLKGGNAIDKIQSSAVLHQELISLFEREMVLDIFVVIGQEMESRENKQYNLLYMEILHHMLKNQDPTLVARSVISKEYEVSKNSTAKPKSSSSHFKPPQSMGSTGSGPNSLRSQLQKERQQLQAANTFRHSHFGGSLVVQNTDGNQRVLEASATQGMATKSTSRGTIPFNSTPKNIEAKRKTKKHQHFVGSGRTLATHTRSGSASASATHDSGPASRKSQRVLYSFCKRFLSKCYGPVMKSLKNEFRRDSSRLEGDDKVIFFRIVWFFCQWARVSSPMSGLGSLAKEKETGDDDEVTESALGHLIFTMDVFTFNLVLGASDYYFDHKKYKQLSQSVALYSEMMQLLLVMYKSKDDTEQIMALGLMDRLFYQTEAIDRLPKLISRWTPGTFTREYLCDLVELIYVTMKLLELNEKCCQIYGEDKAQQRRRKRRKDEAEADTKDAFSRMKEMAAEFDVTAYFGRKIVSNQVVVMFTQLLSQYNINSAKTNDHIISFFVRVCKFVVKEEDEDNTMMMMMGQSSRKDPETKKITLEPMLYNISLLNVLNELLNDQSLWNESDFYPVLSFATTIVKHYATLCAVNPMLHVEALFQHPQPHRFCEASANMYVSEELQMIIERDYLMSEQKKGKKCGDEDEIEDKAELDDDESTSENNVLKSTRAKKVQDNDTTDNEGMAESVSKHSNNVEESKSDSETILAEKATKTERLNMNDEDSEDEDRWNARRAYKPKLDRKSQHAVEKSTVETESSLNGEEKMDQGNKESEDKEDNMRKRKLVLQDSDDEENSINCPVSKGDESGKSPLKRFRRIVDDESDEDS